MVRIRYGIAVLLGACATFGSGPALARPVTDVGVLSIRLAQANGSAVPSHSATLSSLGLPGALIQRFGLSRPRTIPAAASSGGAGGDGLALDADGIPPRAAAGPVTGEAPDAPETSEVPGTLAQAGDQPAPPPQIAPPDLVPPALAARPPITAQSAPIAPPSAPAAPDVPPPPPVIVTNVPPPPPPPPPSLKVYVLVGTEQRGPLDESGLADLVRAGDLRDGSYVWMSGMPAWQVASLVPQVASVLADTPQPPPPLAYYIAQDGRTTGPFDRPDLEGMMAAGSFAPTTLVYTSGMAGWAEASAQADLAAMFNISPEPSGAPEDTGTSQVQTDDNESQPAEPAAVEVLPTEPDRQQPVSVNPKPSEPQPGEPEAAEPQIAQPKSGGSQVSGSMDTGTDSPAEPAAGPETAATADPAQPAGPAAPGFDAAAYVVGTWTLTGTQDIPGVGEAPLDITVVYAADGTTTVDARGRSRVVNGYISYISTGTGTWEASATGPAEGPAEITLDDTLEVRLLVRAPGKPTQTVTTDVEDTTVYEVIDEDTMRSAEDGIVLTRAGN